MWTKSACVVLAWSILLILTEVGMGKPVHSAQANIRIANSTEITLTSTLNVGTPFVATTSSTVRYIVQPGDTLSGIAERFAVPGGWPALYAANRSLIGPDPNSIHVGTVLVLPGQMTPARYTVAVGDTLSGIAARFGVRGGWQALYAANRSLIGPDPNVIHSGTVLTVPGPAAPAPTPPAAHPGHHPHRPSPPAPPGGQHRPLPVRTKAPSATGMPTWLKTILLAAGLLIGGAFLVQLAMVIGRGRRQAAARAVQLHRASSGRGPDSGHLVEDRARIVLADYDRLVVTRSKADDTVYVLRPPGEDPKAVLRAARLVLQEEPYEELANQLGVSANWPTE
jgi:LysM repeat protein